MPSHYLNQPWLIVDWDLWNKLRQNSYRNLNIFIPRKWVGKCMRSGGHFVSTSMCHKFNKRQKVRAKANHMLGHVAPAVLTGTTVLVPYNPYQPIASQITSNSTVSSTGFQTNNKEYIKVPHHYSFVRGIRQWPMDSPHKGTVMRKTFPGHRVFMTPVGFRFHSAWASARGSGARSTNKISIDFEIARKLLSLNWSSYRG